MANYDMCQRKVCKGFSEKDSDTPAPLFIFLPFDPTKHTQKKFHFLFFFSKVFHLPCFNSKQTHPWCCSMLVAMQGPLSLSHDSLGAADGKAGVQMNPLT